MREATRSLSPDLGVKDGSIVRGEVTEGKKNL